MKGSIVRANGRHAMFAEITTTGLRYTRALTNDPETWEEWRAQGDDLLDQHEASQWGLGDWWRTGEKIFHEDAAQGVNVKRIPLKRLQNYAWVCNTFAYSRRRESLSFSHHAAVAALEEDDQDKLLDRAEREDLNVDELEGIARDLKEGRHPGSVLLRDIQSLDRRAGELVKRAPAGRIRELLQTAQECLEEASGLLAKRQK